MTKWVDAFVDRRGEVVENLKNLGVGLAIVLGGISVVVVFVIWCHILGTLALLPFEASETGWGMWTFAAGFAVVIVLSVAWALGRSYRRFCASCKKE